MRAAEGQLRQIQFLGEGATAGWIICPASTIPSPGRYLLGWAAEEAEAPLATVLFVAEIAMEGFLAEVTRLSEIERDKAEAAMKDYTDDLKRSNRDLQDFANIASHDLQKPLRKIQIISELLETRYLDGIDERGQGYIHRIAGSAQRMQALILDLLIHSGFSRCRSQSGAI